MFPPDLNDDNIQSSILWYQSYMDFVVKDLKYICRYYGFFILVQELQLFTRNDPFICNSIISKLLAIFDINNCSISADNICFCPICCRLLLCENRPKFGFFNDLSWREYQFHPLLLADFSLGKEAAIACIYLIVSILKLRFFEAFNLAAYFCIKSHTILFLQNLALLLNLFFFSYSSIAWYYTHYLGKSRTFYRFSFMTFYINEKPNSC